MAGVVAARSGRGLGVIGDVLARPLGWLALFVVLGVALSVGVEHHGPISAAGRVSYLESVIKCPPCSGLSIAQSNVAQSKALRGSVSSWVTSGWSNARIEAKVVALYGSDEILQPSNPVIWLLPLVAVVIGGLGVGFVILRRHDSTELVSDEDDEQIVRAAFEELHRR